MKRIVTAAACSMAAIFLLHGDASALGRRTVGYANSYGATYAGIPIVAYGGVGPMYGYAPSYRTSYSYGATYAGIPIVTYGGVGPMYGYTPAQVYTPGYGYGAYGFGFGVRR